MLERRPDTQNPSVRSLDVETVGLRALEPALGLVAYCVFGLAAVWWSGSLRNAVIILIAALPGAVALADGLLALPRAQQMLSGWKEDSARENLARPRATLKAPHPAATGLYASLPDRLLKGVRVSTISTGIGAVLLAAVFGVVGVWGGGDVALIGKPVWKLAWPEPAAALPTATDKQSQTGAAKPDLCSCAGNPCPGAGCLLPTWAGHKLPVQPSAGQTTAKESAAAGGGGSTRADDALVGLSLGLLGGYLATLFSLLQRLRAGAVTGKFLLMCALRAAIGAVIGFSAATTAALAPDGMTSRTAYLLLGMFPSWAYQYLRRKAAELLQASRPGTEPFSLELVAGLDDGIIDRLAEMGTWDVQHLATSRPVELAIKTLYPLPRVADWIDQAILISYVATNISVFRQRGIRGAIDLAQLYSDACGNAELATKEDPEARRARAVKLMDDLARDTKLTAESMMSIGRSLYEDSMVNLVWNLWNIHGSAIEPVDEQPSNDAGTTE